ncbi:unnamed protein product [Amoebophrya sp. A25]|nr:unnamed protein product [Amoebophrya sp. A25]|eukprot:GSA25T00019029001.1
MLLQVSPADVGETACSLKFGARVNAIENGKGRLSATTSI